MVSKKGIDYLVDAAPNIVRELENCKFVIVGGNDHFTDVKYEQQIKNKIKQLGLGNYFIILKNIPEKLLPDFYNIADICVFPSINYESIPTVIYEAMACGKPVITTNNWGIKEIIKDDFQLANERDSFEIFKKIVRILRDKTLADNIGKRNREFILSNLDWHKIAKAHETLYKEVLKF